MKPHLNVHIRSVHEPKKEPEKQKKKEREKPKCLDCGATFAYKSDLKKHFKSVHEGIKSFVCNYDLCDSRFARRYHLKLHVSAVHEKSKPFKCSYCDSAFFEKGKMKRHILNIHESEKAYKCSNCCQKFFSEESLRKHTCRERKKISTGLKFYCEKCNACYTKNYELRSHVAIKHEGKKPHPCQQCDAG